jgi:ribosome-associated translation inhibitor RaiA
MVLLAKLHFVEYVPFDEVEEMLKKRKSRRVIFIDNLTVYKDELKGKKLFEIMQNYPNHLFILIAHEERNEPYTAVAKLAAKLAKIIIHVKGLTCQVYGRCPGGVVTIDESKSMLYWGTQIHQNKEE